MKKKPILSMPKGKYPGLLGMQRKSCGFIEKKMGIKGKKSIYAK